MIKCIASDMDGTLLNSRQTISEENRAAINQAQESGVEFVISTGRSYQEVTYLLENTGIQCPVICSNGAEVRSETGERIASFSLQRDLANEIGDYLDQMGMYFEVYTIDGTYIKDYEEGLETVINIFASANPHFDKEQFLKNAKERIEEGRVRIVDDYQFIFADPSIEILKFLAFSLDKGILDTVDQGLKKWDVAVSSSGYDNLEITNIQAQKGIALETFVKSKNIEMKETMAIGDSYNDLSMFARVGISVAMGNANAEIKKHCDRVTATNNEHGVAKAILEALQIGNIR
ncbi:Cof-type HAD-IIB family hydrolase [Tepidibacillus marianensis]|uniref:Cof-type HAD-IIB family hydrolase n=1 Tax=Tepidibacillus marianensis TaxID=3131995 RepID=UPI0030CF58AB